MKTQKFKKLRNINLSVKKTIKIKKVSESFKIFKLQNSTKASHVIP